jgi:hypothetical protein
MTQVLTDLEACRAIDGRVGSMRLEDGGSPAGALGVALAGKGRAQVVEVTAPGGVELAYEALDERAVGHARRDQVVGSALRDFESRSSSEGRSSTNRHLDFEIFQGVGRTQGQSRTLSRRYDYRVRPEEFAGLSTGEAIICAAGQCFKVRFPLAKPALRETFQVTRYTTPYRRGLNLLDRFDAEFSLKALGRAMGSTRTRKGEQLT